MLFVDLAGSERLKKSKSSGEMLKETGSINRSLFTLGKVSRHTRTPSLMSSNNSQGLYFWMFHTLLKDDCSMWHHHPRDYVGNYEAISIHFYVCQMCFAITCIKYRLGAGLQNNDNESS